MPEPSVPLSHRSPGRAALYSALLLGAGQVYNRQLEKAFLCWIWGAVHLGAGCMLLLLGLLAHWVPRTAVRPPLGDFIADHALAAFLGWAAAGLALWAVGIRDAFFSAERINRGEVVIRYGLQRQVAHVVGSQLLGLIPVIGLFFPPGVVAEAIDAARARRGPDHQRLLREGGQALLEWTVTRLAVAGLGLFALLWLGWWVLRAMRLAP